MPEYKKPSAAFIKALSTEMDTVINGEIALMVRTLTETAALKNKAGNIAWRYFVEISGDDKLTPQTVEFATLKNALGVTADKPFLGKRKLSTLSEDYTIFRANSINGKAIEVAKATFAKGNKGMAPTSVRDIAPMLRRQINTANDKETTSNRAPSAERQAEIDKAAANKSAAWLYGYHGEFTGDMSDGSKWSADTAQRNLIRGVMNRTHIDMAQLRAIPAADLEIARAIIIGILDDVKTNGPTEMPDDSDVPDELPAKGKRARKA
jgi:hypothetical protein